MMTKLHEIDGVQYREVDRKAEVGEYVIQTSDWMCKRGEISRVVALCSDGSGINCAQALAHSEYHVLEPVEAADQPQDQLLQLLDITANLARRVSALEAAEDVSEPNTSDVTPTLSDAVDHPSHYTSGSVEVIDIIQQATAGGDPFTGYCVGNVLKYVMRRNHKHDNPVECLRKAEWYLRKAIEHESAKLTQKGTD